MASLGYSGGLHRLYGHGSSFHRRELLYTNVTLSSDTAGKAYTLLVGGVNDDGYSVVSQGLTITKDTVVCDPTDFVCTVGLLISAATDDINNILDTAEAAIIAALPGACGTA